MKIAGDKDTKLNIMMNMMKQMNEMEFRDNEEVTPKVLASVGDQLIGANLPMIPNINVNDIASTFFTTIDADVGVFTAEAWFSKKKTVAPSEDPNRVEVVLIVGAYDGKFLFQTSKIIRQGTVYLEDYHDMSNDRGYMRCFDGVFAFGEDTIGRTIGEA